jgi:hypothetical protein
VFTLAGCIVGTTGLTGIWGFIVYFVTFFFVSGLTAVKLKFNIEPFFQSYWILFWDGIFGGLLVSFHLLLNYTIH